MASRAHPSSRSSATANVLLALLLAGTLIPILYLVSLSLMSKEETLAGILFSTSPKWENWAYVLGETGIPRSIGNSLIAALGGALLTVVFSVPGARAITRYRVGGATLAATVTSPWLLPPIVAVVPLFTLLRILGLIDTLLGLTLIYALVNVPVAVWLLEGFLRRLPPELDEAAQLDGAGTLRTLLQVIAPLLLPSIIAVGVIVAILNYNEFLFATFFTQSPDSQTMPVALALFYGDRTPHTGRIAAASLAGVVPVFAAAVFLQRWLVGGLTVGSGK